MFFRCLLVAEQRRVCGVQRCSPADVWILRKGRIHSSCRLHWKLGPQNRVPTGQETDGSGILSVPIAVNISAVQFRQKNFCDFIASTLKETGLPPELLELAALYPAGRDVPRKRFGQSRPLSRPCTRCLICRSSGLQNAGANLVPYSCSLW